MRRPDRVTGSLSGHADPEARLPLRKIRRVADDAPRSPDAGCDRLCAGEAPSIAPERLVRAGRQTGARTALIPSPICARRWPCPVSPGSADLPPSKTGSHGIPAASGPGAAGRRPPPFRPGKDRRQHGAAPVSRHRARPVCPWQWRPAIRQGCRNCASPDPGRAHVRPACPQPGHPRASRAKTPSAQRSFSDLSGQQPAHVGRVSAQHDRALAAAQPPAGAGKDHQQDGGGGHHPDVGADDLGRNSQRRNQGRDPENP